jgi:hypothetical protein
MECKSRLLFRPLKAVRSPHDLLRPRLYDLVLRADLEAAAVQRQHSNLCAAQSLRQAEPLAEDEVVTFPPAGIGVRSKQAQQQSASGRR